MRLNSCVRANRGRYIAALAMMIVCSGLIRANAQITPVSDNFNDGQISTGPAWSGALAAYPVSTAAPLEGSHSLRGSTGNTRSVISVQYGTATNLSTANYNWTLLYRDNGSANPDALNNGAAITAGTNHWRFWIAATANDPNNASGIYISHSAGNLKISRRRNRNTWEIATFPISLNTTYSIKVSRRNDGLVTWYIDTGTAEATTSRGEFWITDVLASGSNNIFMIMESNNTASDANRFQWDLAGMFTKNLTIAQLTNGVHNGDLEQGMTNKALIGFSATSSGAVTIEEVRISNTNSNSNTFSNLKLFTSVDDSYATAADNTEVPGAVVTPNGSQFILDNINHTLTNETRNYFLVADVPQTGFPPASMQLSMSCVDCGPAFTNVVTTNEEKVFDFSFSTATYNFLRVFTWNNTTTVGDFTDDWQSANAWTPWGGPPSANDVVIFSKGGSVTPLNIPTQSVKRIVIKNNTTVNITTASLSSGSAVLTLSGSAEDDLVIEAGSSFNITSTGNTLGISLGNAATANIAGLLKFSGKNHSLNAAVPAAINFDSGGNFTGGVGLTGNPFGTTISGAVIFQNGSVLEDQAGLDYFSANNVISLQPASTYRHSSATNAALNNKTFGNIEISSGASLSIAANTYNVMGNLTGAGSLSATTGVINISGDFVHTGAFNAGTGTIHLNGTSQSFRGASYRNLQLSGSGTKTAIANVVVDGALTVGNGIIMELGANALSGSLGSIANNGTIRTSNTSAAPIPASKTWGGVVEYAATNGSQTVATGNYNNLHFTNSSGTNTASGNLVVNGALVNPANAVLDLAAFSLGGSLTSVSNDGTIRTANSATPIVAARNWGGTVEYSSAAGGQTIVMGTYNNLVCTNSSGINMAAGNLVVNGNLAVPANTELNLGSHTLSGSLATISNNGTIRTSSLAAAPIPAAKTWGGTVEYAAASGGQSVAGGSYNNIVFSNSSGTNTATADVVVNGSLTNPANAVFNLGTNKLSGGLSSITNNGTIRTANTSTAPLAPGKNWGGTIEYSNAAGGQTVVTATYNNLLFSNGSGTNTTGGDITINGSLTNPAGSMFDLGSYNLSGTLATVANAGTIRTTSIAVSPIPAGKTWGGTLQYAAATGSQNIISGVYDHLSLQNASGTNIAAGDIQVNGSLTTTAGGTFSLQQYLLSGSMTTINHNGVITTANTSATPFPAGKTWAGSIIFNGTSAQQLPAGIFNNLELANASGASLAGIVRVNGTLALQSGKLALGSQTLTIAGNIAGMSAVNSFTGSAGASLAIEGTGNFGTLYFDQSVNGSSNALKNFTVNRGNLSGNIILGNDLVITGTITPAAGTLNTGGYLTLASSASGTARIKTINPAMFALVGNVHVQRYFTPKTSRRWIFVSSPVAGLSFREAWQDDMFITGPGTGGTICGSPGTQYNSNGFDATVLNAHSVYTYSQQLAARWAGIPNTTSTLLQKGKGYRVLVRGDRSACADQLISQAPPPPAATVVTATGTLTTGDVNVNIDAKTTGTYGYTLIGNPYASEIDFSSFQAANAGVISNKYWTFDPASPNTNYLVYSQGIVAGNNPSGTINDQNGHIIASGQAFFVESINGGTATFSESHKTDSLQQGVFKTNSVKRHIRTTFSKANGTFIDNMVVRFSSDSSVSLAVNPYWDAVTMNSGNFIAGIKEMKSFAIQTRPLNFTNDTVLVRIVSSTTGEFKLNFSEFSGLAEAAEIVLLDLFNGARHDVRANPQYNFSITSNSASQGGRFKLVFRSQASVMPVHYLSLKARYRSPVVELDWKLAFEEQVSNYLVERSADGKEFGTIGTVVSKGNSAVPVQYSFTDAQPPAGKAWYRIRSEETDGPGQISAAVEVSTGQRIASLRLYPNPVKDRLQLQLPGNLQGAWSLTIRNAQGMVVLQQQGSGATAGVDLKNIAAGLYYLSVITSAGEQSSVTFMKL